MSMVAVGTSLPEIGSHLTASVGMMTGQLEHELTSFTVIGGNMGSSTLQQLLLVGVLFIGIGAREYKSRFFIDTYLPMIGTFLLVYGFAYDGVLSRVDGAIMLLVFVGFIISSYRYREREESVPDDSLDAFWKDVLVAVVGFAVVIISAFFTLVYVEQLVAKLGLNGSLVGVISIGLAAALPEFSTVVESIRRDSPYLALGTLIGSNIVNPLVGIGGGALISTYAVPPSLLSWDLPFKFVVAVLLGGWIFYGRDRHAGLREGFALIVCYFLYLSIRIVLFG
jgi:cation:H+ antiporter